MRRFEGIAQDVELDGEVWKGPEDGEKHRGVTPGTIRQAPHRSPYGDAVRKPPKPKVEP